jgi:hypothetical protein
MEMMCQLHLNERLGSLESGGSFGRGFAMCQRSLLTLLRLCAIGDLHAKLSRQL